MLYVSNASEVVFMCLSEPGSQFNIRLLHVRHVCLHAVGLSYNVLATVLDTVSHTKGVGFSMVLDSSLVSAKYVFVLFCFAKDDLFFIGEVFGDVCCLIAILLYIVKVLDLHPLESV